ncbi:T9SS type A sorting domain-containing protein [Rubrivirga marina]|uniref:Secretion system C-terminal sorting domain-containing protein n=1 Tax=Rubrivirga marina TaxID=1196024 RepID=A0A271IW06_9BACT|nr:T9SS type A sorting domain-containing protein [Rubrivirga marina]PAP75382.1 hypothetical protein BSZ37_02440 [Rubrivirga marina]
MHRLLLPAAALALLAWSLPSAQAQTARLAAQNKLSDGGFEAAAPSYFQPSGAGATWSAEQARTAGYSLKLSGSGAASWTMDEAIRNWVPAFPANADLEFGAFVWADGVNTAPASDDAKFQLVYSFRDAAGNDLLGQDIVLDLPQDAASTGGWVEVSTSDLGAITFPAAAASATITVRKGASATGTVYVDDFFVRTGTEGVWPGDIFNANVDVSGGWYYYWDNFPRGGDWPDTQAFDVTVTDADAHTGGHSLRIEQLDPTASEAVAISERVPVTPGVPVLVSYWLKTEGNADPATIGQGDNNVGMTALWYSSLESGAAGYNELGGLDIRLNGEYNPNVIPLLPQQADNGWTQYAFVVYPREDAVGMELRLRYWHSFTGTTYWDDVFIGDAPDVAAELPNLVSEMGFEGDVPSYWSASGSGAAWSAEQSRSPSYSLKLSGSGESSWTMDEAIRNWVPAFPANADLEFGAFVWADGVNTAPASDDAKFQLVYSFRDAAGNDLLGQDIVLDLPQDAASTGGWTRVSTADLGAITFPADATSATIVLRKGASATGTVYVDDFFVRTGTEGVWPGDIFNATVDVPGGWYFYSPDAGTGVEGWPETQPFFLSRTTAEAHTGESSLLIEQNTAEAPEAVAISERVPVTPGEPVLISYWLKTEGNADPSTIGQGDNNVGLTALWYSSLESGAAGYNELGGLDIRLNGEYNPNVIPLYPQTADNDWTNYAFVVYPREDAVGMELRLRYWHAFTGSTYWDDVSITNIGSGALFATAGEGGPDRPVAGAQDRWLRPNAPNPFGAGTTVRFALPEAAEVTLEVYDMVGRRVAVLADRQPMAAQEHALALDGRDLTSGTYLLVLRTPSHSEALTITVVR